MDKLFKLFTVKHILDVTQTKSVVAKKDLIKGNIPYVTRTVSDNGYMGTCGNTDKINPGNCITIGAETGVAFYQPADFVAGNKVYRLSADDLTEKHYLYLAGALNKLTKNYSYSNARTPEKIKKEQILLPVIQDESGIPIIDTAFHYHDDGYIPDWQYMQDRIAELEQDRIAELEQDRIAELDAYLKATGLEDYTLTEEDKEVLSLSSEAVSDEGDALETDRRDGKIRFGKFKIGDLFEKKTMRGYPKIKENLTENPDGYYVYGQNIRRQYHYKMMMDEMYLHRVDANQPILAYTSSVGEIGMIEESFYRSGDNGAFQGLFPKHKKYSTLESLYLLTCLRKHFATFDYSTSMNNTLELQIVLPIQIDNSGEILLDPYCTYHPEGLTPDWSYMERYIRAIEKMTIENVVKYRDRELYAAKQAVC